MTEELSIENEVLKELVGIDGEKGIFVFVPKPDNYHNVKNTILGYFIQKLKLTGIYITLNISYSEIVSQLEKYGIDTTKLYFIDGISKASGKIVKTDNCVCIENPQSLTELSLTLTTETNTGKFSFIFLDSISTLLIYNDMKTTEKFSHYIISKIRNLDLSAIIMVIDEENSKKLLPIISQFCDRSIYI